MEMSDTQIKSFLAIQTHERFAKLFIKYTPTKLVVISQKEIFMFNKEFNYYQPVGIRGKLMSLVSDVLHAIIEPWSEPFERKFMEIKLDKTLNKEDKDEEAERIKKILKSITNAIKCVETTSFINSIIDQIISILMLTAEEQEKLNRLPNYLNFKNGKLNLKTLDFTSRIPDDFITEFLDYDFKTDADPEKVKEVKGILKRICNSDKEDYTLVTDFLGYAITSETKEQKFFNGLGPSASNGKSTIIKLVEEAFSIYVYKAKKDLFCENYSKAHKYFAEMKGKRICYIEEQDKKKQDAELMKDVVDGNKMNNEVLFATTEKIMIQFKLLFLSNKLMNFDADNGMKRRIIHFDFKNKFVEKENVEKEQLIHKEGKVYPLDKTLQIRFRDCDDLKNALVHILILKSKQYFDQGLKVPSKYEDLAKDMCEENDKFKNFFDSHFVVTGDENDRVSKKEINDMMNVYNKCNYSERTIVDDIKRLQLNYQRLLRAPYKGASERGVVVGIRKRDYVPDEESTPDFVEEKPMASDLDFGLDMEYVGQEHPSVTIEERSNAEHLNLLSQASLLNELQKELREEKKQKNEYWDERDALKEEVERLKAEIAELKKKGAVSVPTVPEPITELKCAYAQIKEERAEMTKKWRLYYDMWYATLSEEDKKKETERYHNEGACQSENRIGTTDWVHEYEKLINKQKKAIKVPVLEAEVNFIDELEAAPVKVVESEQEPDFLDELEAAPVKQPKTKDKRNETMDKMQLKLSKK
jgi:phage/plasmid-associated DNA primase